MKIPRNNKYSRSLRALDLTFKRAISKTVHHHKICLAVFSIIIGFSAYNMKDLKQTVLFDEQSNPDFESTRDFRELKELYGEDENLGVIFLPDNHLRFTNKELCSLLIKTNDVSFASGKVNDIFSAFKLRQAQHQGSQLLYPQLLTTPCDDRDESYSMEPVTKSPWAGLLLPRSGQDFMVNFYLPLLQESGIYGRFDAANANQIITALQQDAIQPPLLFGTVAQYFYTLKGFEHAQFLNLGILILLIVGIRLLIGTWKAGFIYAATLLSTCTIIYGSMAYFNQPTDPLIICLFMILAVACLEDFIFVSYYKMNGVSRGLHPFKSAVTASFFTSFTTILGFGSLMTSSVASIERFGGWAALGCLIEWIIVHFVLPALLNFFPSWGNWASREKAFFLENYEKSVKWFPPRAVVMVTFLVFAYPLLNLGEFKLTQNPTDMFPSDHPLQQAAQYVENTRGWVTNASLVFPSGTNDQFKSDILSKISGNPLVVKTETYQKALDFVSFGVNEPLTRDLVAREFNITSMRDRYLADSGEERAFVYLKSSETSLLSQLLDEVKSFCPNRECWLSGAYVLFADYSKQVISTLFESLFFSFVEVMIVIFYLTKAFGSRQFWPIMFASFWGPLGVLALIKVTGTDINIVTCIVAGLLVGFAGDNSIHFLFAEGDNLRSGIEKRGSCSIQCSILMSLSCLVFLGSYFEPPRNLGVLLSVGFLLCLIGDVWILKSLLSISSYKPKEASK